MPPSPPVMAHLLSLGTQSKDAAQALKTEWYVCGSVRLPPCACMCASPRVRGNRTETEREVLSLTISAARLNICVCQPAFVTGAPAFVLAAERVYPYLDGRRAGCQSTSACLRCSINNISCHNPNLTSPPPASEQHQWYMGTSGRPLCYRFSA